MRTGKRRSIFNHRINPYSSTYVLENEVKREWRVTIKRPLRRQTPTPSHTRLSSKLTETRKTVPSTTPLNYCSAISPKTAVKTRQKVGKNSFNTLWIRSTVRGTCPETLEDLAVAGERTENG